MSANEFVDLLLARKTSGKGIDTALGRYLRSRVQVLELVHSLEFDNIETIGKDAVGFAFQQMLGLVGSDVGDRGEDICAVRGGALDAVPVVDAALASLMINVEVLEVVVEVDASGAQVTTEQGGVGCEDGGHVDVTFAEQGNCKTSLPFVEVSDDGSV